MKMNLSWKKDKYSLTFIVTIILFFLIKISQIGFKFSDENIYFYMANLLLHGQLPYQNFFFASPPLQIMILAGFMGIFGSEIILLKLLPILASIITSTLIFLIIKKNFNSLQGLLASTLYLFSFVILTTTDHSTGIHLAAMFLIISYYYLDKGRYLLAGIIASFSLLTRLYSAVVIMGILIYLLIKDRKALLKFIFGVAIIFIPVNLILILIFKSNYLDPVFFYHFLKSTGISKLNIFRFFLKWDFVLIVLSLIALFLKNKKKFLLPIIILITTTLFYLVYLDIYYLYLGLLIPFLAILGSSAIIEMIKKIKEKNKLIIIIFILILLILPNSFFYIRNQAQTAKITGINEMVLFIQENSNPKDTIYGDFEITPLIALLSNRKITNNYVDTNEKTFLSKIYNITERTEEIKKGTKFVIMKTLLDKNKNPIYFKGIINSSFLLEECKMVKEYPIKKDYQDNTILIFDCS